MRHIDRGGACPRRGAPLSSVFCLSCYTNRKGRTNYTGHSWCRGGIPRALYSLPWFLVLQEIDAMKREQAARQSAKGKFVPPTDPMLEGLPRLSEGVADHTWDDGTPREPWSLSINWSGPMPTVMLNDKEVGRSCASTAATVREAMEMLEGLIAKNALPWRYWQQKKGRKG